MFDTALETQFGTAAVGQGSVLLADGHRVSVTFAGRGLPFVFVHGFLLSGPRHADLLRALAGLGFRAIAIDVAGHGGSTPLRRDRLDVDAYSDQLALALDELGIRRGIVCGHSAGGRLAAQFAVEQPERVVGLVLVSAALGAAWDDLVRLLRYVPPALGAFSAQLLAGAFLNVPPADLWSTLSAPWRPAGLGLSILHARPSRVLLDGLRTAAVPAFVVHGDRDAVVPVAAARDAALRADGELVEIRGGTHFWLLDRPREVHEVLQRLLHGGLGGACADALEAAGLDPHAARIEEIEDAFYEPGAAALTAAESTFAEAK